MTATTPYSTVDSTTATYEAAVLAYFPNYAPRIIVTGVTRLTAATKRRVLALLAERTGVSIRPDATRDMWDETAARYVHRLSGPVTVETYGLRDNLTGEVRLEVSWTYAYGMSAGHPAADVVIVDRDDLPAETPV